MDLCESEQLREVFFAYACKRQKAAKDSNQRFVYYTSADTALKIVERGELWMRNATVMNDFFGNSARSSLSY